MSNRSLQLTDNLYDYLLTHSLREKPVLQALREETMKDSMSVMQIAPEQGQFLQLLVKILGAKKLLEIGVYTGYSSLCCALALPVDGKIVACDINKEWTDIARRYWQKAGVTERIQLELAPALLTLDNLLAKGESASFDFAFIDADKENYLQYYEKTLELIKPGGVIAIDNVLWSGAVADPAVNDADTVAIRELNKHVHQDKRVEVSLLPLADGLTLARKVGA